MELINQFSNKQPKEIDQVWNLYSYLWGRGLNDFFGYLYPSFLLKKNNLTFHSINEILSLINDKDIYEYIKNFSYEKNSIGKVFEDLLEYDEEVIKDCISSYFENDKYYYNTASLPHNLLTLARNFLSFDENSRFVDANCGHNGYLINGSMINPFKNYKEVYAFQSNRSLYIRNKIRAEVENVIIKNENKSLVNVKDIHPDESILLPHYGSLSEPEFSIFNEFYKDQGLENIKTSEGAEIIKLIDDTNQNGTVIGFMTAGFTSKLGRGEVLCRKYLIEKEYVEAVINLPEDVLQPYSGVRIAMLILTKKKNKSVRFVDASKLIRGQKRGIIEFEKIMEAYRNDSAISKTISYKDFDSNYVLNPDFYLAKREAEIEGAEENIELGNVAEIIRGCNSIQKDLNLRYSSEDTNIKFLTASWPDERTMPSSLTSLKEIKDNELKYCLKEGDFILSKMGNPKFDVAENIKNKKIIVSGNLYIIRFDQTKVHPKYVKCFFESCEGFDLLESALTGTVTLTLSVDMLKKIKLPLVPYDKQLEVVNAYNLLDGKKKQYYREIEQINRRMDSLFGDVLKNGKDALHVTDDGEIY